MNTQAYDLLCAARVPATLQPQEFGLWRIQRRTFTDDQDGRLARALIGFDSQTILLRVTDATIHVGGEVVMEDSITELARHLPIIVGARGRVLVAGLGLGCVVRGLLANSRVEHVDVIEMDPQIVRVVGPEFEGNRRCRIILDNALTWQPPADARWDFAWHDIWCEGNQGLQEMHGALVRRFIDHVDRQGAWNFPRSIGKRVGLLGAPKHRNALINHRKGKQHHGCSSTAD